MNAVQRLGGAAALAVAAALVMSGLALASDVNVAVVDVTTPTNAVTLAPGDTASITINMSVTGQQSGTATFEVYRDWTLRTDGTWQGSNPEEFTVPPRSANASATTFSTSGTVSIAAGRAAGGPFTLAIGAFGITNSNTSGAKLNDGSDSNYAVTVSAPPPPANTPPVVSVLNIGSDVVVEKGSPEPTPSCAVVDAQQPTASAVPDISRSGLNEFGLGVVTVTCSFTDNGGLGDSDEASYTIVDTTEPVITFQSRTAANAHGWNSGAVTVTWSCDDGDGSGVVSRSVEQVVSTSGANQSSTGTCTDNADNESTNTVQGINIDTTAPTIQYIGHGANPAGWNNAAATATWSCSDALSGPISLTDNKTVASEGSDQTATGTCSDKAGNTASDTVDTINIDLTPPTSAVAGVTNGSVYPTAPTVTCLGSDALSGIQSHGVVSGNTLTPGGKSVTCNTATDRAGNVQTQPSAALSYTLAPVGGFNSNFDGSAVLRVKPNQAIPLRWAFNDGTRNHALLATATLSSVTSTRCTSAEGVDGTEPASEIAAGASGLQLLPDNSYQMNWKATSTTGCRALTVTMTFVGGGTATRAILVDIRK